MSFKPEFEEVYEKIYKTACKDKVDCQRVDESKLVGSITTDIINKILDADFIIADLTLSIANVFYELGFAHTARKPVILTTQEKRGNLPFDIRPLRVIKYKQTPDGIAEMVGELKEVIRVLLETPPETFDNPIDDALRRRKYTLRRDETATPPLDKKRLKQLIRLHLRSTSYLADVRLDSALFHLKNGSFTGNSPEYTRFVYEKILESAKDCAGFSGKCIPDVYEFLKKQFPCEYLGRIIDEVVEKYLSLPEIPLADKRKRAGHYIEVAITSIFGEIEDEIDRLYDLPECV
jgi:hypothetical protein